MQGSSAAGPAGFFVEKMGLQNKQVSYTYILSYYIVMIWVAPPSQQWQMKFFFFFCDLLLKSIAKHNNNHGGDCYLAGGQRKL